MLKGFRLFELLLEEGSRVEGERKMGEGKKASPPPTVPDVSLCSSVGLKSISESDPISYLIQFRRAGRTCLLLQSE